jgi:hypothetical protein
MISDNYDFSMLPEFSFLSRAGVAHIYSQSGPGFTVFGAFRRFSSMFFNFKNKIGTNQSLFAAR